VHLNNIVIYIQKDATLHSLFFWKLLCMFRVVPHPSSGAQTTVSTVCGVCHTVTAICRYRGKDGTGLSVLCCVVRSVAADSSNSVINTRCCRYSCVEVPPETCRAVFRKINCVTLHLVGCTLQYCPMSFSIDIQLRVFSSYFMAEKLKKTIQSKDYDRLKDRDYSGSTVTNNRRCTRDIKSRTATAKNCTQ
jgi:hypothetical protein